MCGSDGALRIRKKMVRLEAVECSRKVKPQPTSPHRTPHPTSPELIPPLLTSPTSPNSRCEFDVRTKNATLVSDDNTPIKITKAPPKRDSSNLGGGGGGGGGGDDLDGAGGGGAGGYGGYVGDESTAMTVRVHYTVRQR